MKLTVLFFVSLMTVLAFPIISNAPNHGPGKPPPPRIGAILTLTGDLSYIGGSQLNIIRKALENVNKAGGIKNQKLELLVKDDSGLPENSIIEANKFINEEVIAIMGGSTISTSKVLVEGSKIPTFVLAPVFFQHDNWVFRLAPNYSSAVEKILDHMAKNNIRDIVLFNDKTEFGISGFKAFLLLKEKYGVNIRYHQEYDFTKQDFTSELLKAKGTGSKAIVNWTIGPARSILVREWKKLGSTNISFYESPAFVDMSFVKSLGEIADGVWAPVLIKTKGELSIFEASALDSFNLIVSTLGESYPEFTWKRIKDQIEKKKEFIGSIGVYSFSPKDHYGLAENPFAIAYFGGGKWILK